MKRKTLITFLAATTAVTCSFGLVACDGNDSNDENDGHVHDYVASVVEPTCTEQGYTLHTCKDCDENYKDNYVNALNHDLQHHAAQTATCRNVGWQAYDVCSRCDYSTYEEIAKIEHSYSNYICTTCYSVD
ncbi:MAG: hypothetical protein K2G96_03740, partial [Clostridia bacterium]|nr:hypothetical protein [Clostridia bacterium]